MQIKKVGFKLKLNTGNLLTLWNIHSIATFRNGDFLVVWSNNDGQIYGQGFDFNGGRISSGFQISSSLSKDNFLPYVSTFAYTNFVVVWKGNGGLYGQIFDYFGDKSGSEFHITHSSSRPAVGAFDDGKFIVVWTGYKHAQGGGPGYRVFGQMYNARGIQICSEFQVNTYNAYKEHDYANVGTFNNGEFVVVWASDKNMRTSYDVYGQRFNANCTQKGSEFLINNYTAGYQDTVDIATFNDGKFVVVWSSTQYPSLLDYGMRGQTFDSNGIKIGYEFHNNNDASIVARPSVATLGDNKFVVVWEDGGQIFDLYGVKISPEFQREVVGLPNVETFGNKFILTFSEGSYSTWGIYGQIMMLVTETLSSTATPTLTATKVEPSLSNLTETLTAMSSPAKQLASNAISAGALITTSSLPSSTLTSTKTSTISVAPTVIPEAILTDERCLKLISLHIESIGDLDKTNEEIEIEVVTSKNKLDCGLFLFELPRKDKNLQISIPCDKEELVNLRFLERDVCNDDMALKNIECEATDRVQTLAIEIHPDRTTYDQCIEASTTVPECGGLGIEAINDPKIGGAFCHMYHWGKKECGFKNASESISSYELRYKVTPSSCLAEWDKLENAKCDLEGHLAGPNCSSQITSEGVHSDFDWYTGTLILAGTVLFLSEL